MKELLFMILIIVKISLTIEQKVIDLIPTSIYNKKFPQVPSTDYFPKYPDELFIAEVNIGSPVQTFHLIVDTTAFPMWIQANDSVTPIGENQTTYNQSVSTFYESLNNRFHFKYKDNTCYAEMITDQIAFGSLKEFNLSFPLVKEYSLTMNKIDGVLGLSRAPCPNEKFGQVHSFIRNSQGYDHPEKNVFSLHFFDSYVPKLFIGKEHSDFSRRDQIGSCDAIKMMNNYWGCPVTQILFNDTSILVKTEVVFDTSIERIYFPDKLKDTFKKIISQRHCKEIDDDDGTTYFNCNSLEDYVPFYLALGETVLKLPRSLFIRRYENSKLFLLKVNFSSKYHDIRLGTNIFKYYHILFDEKNKKIKFYAENENNIASLKDFKIMYKESSAISYYSYYVVVTIVILIGVIISSIIATNLIMNKKKKNKKKSKDYDESNYTQLELIQSS